MQDLDTPTPNSRELEVVNFERNIRAQERRHARFEVLNLQREVYGWALEHFGRLTPEVMHDLFERIGMRGKP